MKSLDVGGEIRALQESSDGWWTFDHAIAGGIPIPLKNGGY
jgi:6-phosphogluconate dehydrogenase (decarboxylating)